MNDNQKLFGVTIDGLFYPLPDEAPEKYLNGTISMDGFQPAEVKLTFRNFKKEIDCIGCGGLETRIYILWHPSDDTHLYTLGSSHMADNLERYEKHRCFNIHTRADMKCESKEKITRFVRRHRKVH